MAEEFDRISGLECINAVVPFELGELGKLLGDRPPECASKKAHSNEIIGENARRKTIAHMKQTQKEL